MPRFGARLAWATWESGDLRGSLSRLDDRRGGRARARAILKRWSEDRIDTVVAAADCHASSPGSSGYAEGLLDLDLPPAAVFWRGETPAWPDDALSIVGSRNSSQAGRAAAHGFGRAAAGFRVTVVSGMAYGVDTAAHIGALDGGGRTIAVLAGGADEPSPKGRRKVYERILDNGGTVLSEYPPGSQPAAYRFPIRNRIIAAMGRRLLVIEAGLKSGSLHTVDHALALGRTVFSVPSDVTRETGMGSNRLIQDGAAVALGPEDLFDGWRPPVVRQVALPKLAEELLSVLASGPCSLQELVERTNGEVSAILSALGGLESDSRIQIRSGWVYPIQAGV